MWKVVQVSLLLSDFAGLSGVYFALERQGRLGVGLWSADDAAVGGTYLVLTAIRLAFVLGWGFGRDDGVGKGKGKGKRN